MGSIWRILCGNSFLNTVLFWFYLYIKVLCCWSRCEYEVMCKIPLSNWMRIDMITWVLLTLYAVFTQHWNLFLHGAVHHIRKWTAHEKQQQYRHLFFFSSEWGRNFVLSRLNLIFKCNSTVHVVCFITVKLMH